MSHCPQLIAMHVIRFLPELLTDINASSLRSNLVHRAGNGDRTPHQSVSRAAIGRQTSNLYRHQGQQPHQTDADEFTPMQRSGGAGNLPQNLHSDLTQLSGP